MQSPFPLLLLDAKGTGALYGHVDVLVIHVLPEVHGGMSLRHADHGLEVSHCDGHAVADGALLAQVRVHLPHPATAHYVLVLRLAVFLLMSNSLSVKLC